MGEQVVLADLRIDASGVAQGINQALSSFSRGEAGMRRLGSTADAVTSKLFSFRSAGLKLAGAFGIAGLAYSAANALATLTKDLISSTTWFKNASSAVRDWYGEMVHGEDAIARLGRKLDNLGATGALLKLRDLVSNRATLASEMSGLRASAAAPSGPAIPLSPFAAIGAGGPIMGSPSVNRDSAAAIKAVAISVQSANREINSLVQTLARQGMSLAGIKRLTGASLQFDTGVDIAAENEAAAKALQENTEKARAEEAESRRRALEAAREQKRIAEELAAIPVPADGFNLLHALDIEGVQLERLREAADMVEQMNIGFRALAGSFDAPKDALSEMTITLAEATTKMEILQSVAATTGQIIGHALTEGGQGLRQAIGSMLKDLARLYIVKAVEQLVLGVMASTPWGQAAGLGPPAPYFAAAKLWGVAAALAGGASAALGGGGGGGGGGGSRGGGSVGAALTGGGGGGPNVTVVIQGSVIGVGMSRDEFARSIAEDIEKARSDGSR